MTTTTTGVFFVGKDYPGRPAVSEHVDDNKDFVLKMRLIDNQGPGRVEGYVVRWLGPNAEAWRKAHPALKAGDALRLVLINPRSLLGPRGSPETSASVSSCELLPARAPAAQPA
ncbi:MULTISPECIES: hypothetical protein [Variovorax]|uniref:Uncharacterized protein n=1 Tax=Variovorax boronicumulans TaxID=436515 RepID=A0A250DHP3_9BURK|nr:hypothetical protein [Variovorax boronicumulans]ATA53897.1 hypothetical protein CKY39_12215 [Variovorax boronicumulans]